MNGDSGCHHPNEYDLSLFPSKSVAKGWENLIFLSSSEYFRFALLMRLSNFFFPILIEIEKIWILFPYSK